VTRLRKMMLEELERRTIPKARRGAIRHHFQVRDRYGDVHASHKNKSSVAVQTVQWKRS
jgi:hypothetical protein